MVFIVSLISDTVITKRYITNSYIKKAIRQIGFFKALDSDISILIRLSQPRRIASFFLIKLSGNSTRQVVQFYTVQLAFFHALGK